MKKIILKLDRILNTSLAISPIQIILRIVNIPLFIKNLISYSLNNNTKQFKISFTSLYPILSDRTMQAGSTKGHYFLQDLYYAQLLYNEKPNKHYDVGSRVDGFVSNVASFREINFIDIRPLDVDIKNINFIQGSITELPFQDNSLESVSSLHVIEHIGLGRYGDPLNPNGYLDAAKELSRVLAKGGKLYLSTPCGKEQLYFDAHRVFDPKTIVNAFSELTLKSYSLIDDNGSKIIQDNDFSITNNCEFGCGLFIFQK